MHPSWTYKKHMIVDREVLCSVQNIFGVGGKLGGGIRHFIEKHE